jgi:RNA polymerase sigma-70 factor, ECF subfamily
VDSEVTSSFRELMIAEIPALRAFAISLCRSSHKADDLVQDTLLRAWGNADSFQTGTNMRAWLFTILRNAFYSLHRKEGREVADANGEYAARIAVPGEQDGAMDLADFRKALARLPDEQREALILIGASGLSYEQAAEICEVAVGTIKSRVNRARVRLSELLNIEGPSDLGSTRPALAVVRGDTVLRT